MLRFDKISDGLRGRCLVVNRWRPWRFQNTPSTATRFPWSVVCAQYQGHSPVWTQSISAKFSNCGQEQCVPFQFVLRGAFRAAIKVSMQEILNGVEAHSEVRAERGWKLLVLLPRMLLFRPARGGVVPHRKLEDRIRQFQGIGSLS